MDYEQFCELTGADPALLRAKEHGRSRDWKQIYTNLRAVMCDACIGSFVIEHQSNHGLQPSHVPCRHGR